MLPKMIGYKKIIYHLHKYNMTTDVKEWHCLSLDLVMVVKALMGQFL